ncbi:MAG: DUF4062 domain-containing protein [Anaerolineaceae bacterium]|nr:DUF4062 domain-containing protein [Anaerolineaceae bacterium]
MEKVKPGNINKPRVIRVFISSTFKDMGAERDYLVKFIFPQLRFLCESRNVTWGDVDLRWGVTDEQKADGQVLPICLEEIVRCRPFFIGLLGERYGWVPDQIPPELVAREHWLEQHQEDSVTELEMVHGVLRNPNMNGHAFFYFRDPTYLSRLPPGTNRNDFKSENEAALRKLEKLKQKLRQARDNNICQLRECYRDPHELGNWILDEFTALINRLVPETLKPGWLEREAVEHDAFASTRTRVYIGRQNYFKRLENHVAGEGPPLVVLGESGSGKSAMLANWVEQHRITHPNDLILIHFLGASAESSSYITIIRRIMGEIKQNLGVSEEIPDDLELLRSTFINWLSMAGEQLEINEHSGEPRGKFLLILDGLNQLEDRDAAPDLLWLPSLMPPNVRLIVSTLPGRSLQEIRNRKWVELCLSPLILEERRRLIVEILARYAKTLSPERLEKLARTPACANPLYLSLVLDELRLFGEHEHLDERISYYLESPSLHDLFIKIITRWKQDYGENSKIIEDTLTLLWASRRGLSEAELLEILGTGNGPLPRAEWSPFFLAMSGNLVSRSGLLNFAHDYLRTAVQDNYLSTEFLQLQSHMRLADHFINQPPSERRTEELPWQLSRAKKWPQLAAYLSLPNSLGVISNKNRFDFNTFWAEIEENSSIQMVNTYQKYIDNPNLLEANAISKLHILLRDTGHLDQALLLFDRMNKPFKLDPNMQIQKAWTLNLSGNSKEALSILEKSTITSRIIGDKMNLAASLGTQASILRHQGKINKAIKLHKQEEKLYRQIGSLEGISTSLGNQAILLTGIDNKKAMMLLQEAERISRQIGDLAGLQGLIGQKAELYVLRGENEKAILHLEEQEQMCKRLGMDDGIAQSLSRRAQILIKQGRSEEAATLCNQAEIILRSINRPTGLQAMIGLKGDILFSQGDLDGAMALYKEQEHLCLVIDFPAGLEECLGAQGNILEKMRNLSGALLCFEQAGKIAKKIGSPNLMVWINYQAKIKLALNDLNEAMNLFQEMETCARKINHKGGIASSVGGQGLVLFERGQFEEALRKFEEAISLSRQAKDREDIQPFLSNTGIILKKMGRFDEALEKFLELEKLCAETNNKKGLCASLLEQGDTLYLLGMAKEAFKVLKRAEILSREINDLSSLSCCLGRQARIVFDRADQDGAVRLLQEQEQIAREANELGDLADSIGNQAIILFQQKLFDEALKRFQEEESLWLQTNNQGRLQTCLGNQGLVLRQKGQYIEAINKFRAQEKICHDTDEKNGLCKAFLEQSETLNLLGKPAEAIKALRSAEEISRRVNDSANLRMVLLRKGNMQKNHGQLDDAEVTFKEQEHLCRQENDFVSLGTNLGAQSEIAMARGQMHTALELVKEQERLCRSTNNQKGLTASLSTQGDILAHTGNRPEAKRLYKEAIQACRLSDDYDRLQNHLGVLGWVHRECGELDEATKCFEEQERISREIGTRLGLESSLGGLGTLARDLGYRDKALRLFKEQEEICKQIGNLRDLQGSLNNQGLIYWDIGEYNRAMAIFKSVEQTSRKMGNMEILWHTLYNQSEILYRHLGKRNAARNKLSEAVNILRQSGMEPGWLERCQELLREIVN